MRKLGIYVIPLFSIFLSTFLFSVQLFAQPRVLVVLPNQFGANSHFNFDNLAEYGYVITTTGVSRQVNSCTWSASIGSQSFRVDTLLTEINSADAWDVIAIMSMQWQTSQDPYGDLIDCAPFMNLLRDAKMKGKIIWATCAGVRVLAAADIINGVKVTGQGAYSQEYIAAGAIFMGPSIPPVLDQNIITSTRGMYYMQENNEIISSALEKSGKSFNRFANAPLVDDIQSFDLEIALWDHQFVSDASQGLRSVCANPEGGFIAIGYTWANPGHNSDLLLVKTDISGNLIWNKTFGDTGWEFGWSVISTSDGGFLGVGSTSSTRSLDKNVYVIKIDSDGNLLWERQLGGGGVDVARDVLETSDGSLIIVGYTEQASTGEHDVLVIKLDAEGEYQWTKTIGDIGPEAARCIIQNKDGNFIIAGETGSVTTGNMDMLMICMSQEGSVLWQNSYHKDNYDSGYEVIENPSGGYYLIGHGDIHGSDFLEMAVVKTDEQGNCLSHTMYEATTRFYDYGKSIAMASDGTLAFCGAAKKKDTRQNKLFLILIDPDGRTLIDKWYDLEGSSWCTTIIADRDNNFVIAGQTTLDNTCRSWLFKIQNPQVAGINISNAGQNRDILCFPNPFSDQLSIQTTSFGQGTGRITIFNAMGKVVRNWETNFEDSSIQYWDARKNNGEQIEPGCYLVRFTSNPYTGYQKVMFLTTDRY